MKVFSFIFIIGFLFLAASSCGSKGHIRLSVERSDSIHPIKVTLKELEANASKYQGQYIETEGYLHFILEGDALWEDSSRKGKPFLVRVTDTILLSRAFDKVATKGSIVRLKGRIDTPRLKILKDEISASIYDVCFIETQ